MWVKPKELNWTTKLTGSNKKSTTSEILNKKPASPNNALVHKLTMNNILAKWTICSRRKISWFLKLTWSSRKKTEWTTSENNDQIFEHRSQLFNFTSQTSENATQKSKRFAMSSRTMRKSINSFMNLNFSRKTKSPTFIVKELSRNLPKRSEPWSGIMPLSLHVPPIWSRSFKTWEEKRKSSRLLMKRLQILKGSIICRTLRKITRNRRHKWRKCTHK